MSIGRRREVLKRQPFARANRRANGLNVSFRTSRQRPTQDEIARIRKRKRGRNMLSLETRVSVAAYTTEPDHFLCMLNITETWSCMFPPRFRNTETCDFVLCAIHMINSVKKLDYRFE